jgi:FkbM family methyltransferase
VQRRTIPGWINSFARRLPGRLPRLSGLVRLLLMHAFRMVDDADFHAVRHLALGDRSHPHPVVCDIGANAGQSAIALGHLIPRSVIVSFEPQPAFRRELRLAQWLLGRRHTVRFVALGAESKEEQRLFIPLLDGVERLARASIVQGGAAHESARRSISVPLRTLDDQDLAPAFVKIDVEGAEADVLRGGERTIRDHRPVVMAEIGSSFNACTALLESWNYSVFSWDAATSTFGDVGTSINFFAIPRERLHLVPRT